MYCSFTVISDHQQVISDTSKNVPYLQKLTRCRASSALELVYFEFDYYDSFPPESERCQAFKYVTNLKPGVIAPLSFDKPQLGQAKHI